MKFNFIEILIFGLSVLFLIFSLILWFGRPKIDSTKKDKPPKNATKRDRKNKAP